VHRLQPQGEVATGLLFVDPDSSGEMHALSDTDARPLVSLPYEELCPGAAALDELMGELR